ncbi:hypothetical protein [Nonomuraea rubra]|uniref:hypothetical protein n=1 Tax=Nonomuraea rubra TaxID=46180 RepID=UPI0031F0AC90
MGRLIRKIMRQPVPKKSASTSQPASTGPPTEEMVMTGPETCRTPCPSPVAGNISLISPSPCRQHHGPEQALHRPARDEHLGADGDAAQE